MKALHRRRLLLYTPLWQFLTDDLSSIAVSEIPDAKPGLQACLT